MFMVCLQQVRCAIQRLFSLSFMEGCHQNSRLSQKQSYQQAFGLDNSWCGVPYVSFRRFALLRSGNFSPHFRQPFLGLVCRPDSWHKAKSFGRFEQRHCGVLQNAEHTIREMDTLLELQSFPSQEWPISRTQTRQSCKGQGIFSSRSQVSRKVPNSRQTHKAQIVNVRVAWQNVPMR